MTGPRCPTCWQTLPERKPTIRSAAELVAAMSEPPPPGDARFDRAKTRNVYEGYTRGTIATGRFYLTYGAGITVAREAVEEAIRLGLILPTWPDFATGSWSLPKQAEENQRRHEARVARNAARRELGDG